MSDYGLVVKNNNQEIQIDSKYRNLSLDQSGSGVSISNGNTSATAYTRINVAASPLLPLVLIQPNTDDYITVRNYYKSGSNFSGVDVVTKYNQSTTINWKSYRENRTLSNEDYGLLVYNSGNNLCFDSGKDYFKIYSVHTGINLSSPPAGLLDGDYSDISHDGISNPYCILSSNSFWQRMTHNPQANYANIYLWVIGFKKLSSTSIRIGWYIFGYFQLGMDESEFLTYNHNTGYNPTMKLIVCDTT